MSPIARGSLCRTFLVVVLVAAGLVASTGANGAGSRSGEKVGIHLIGGFAVNGKWIESTFENQKPGSAYVRRWVFFSNCTIGACSGSMSIISGGEGAGTVKMKPVNPSGAIYVGDRSVEGPVACRVGLKVTKVKIGWTGTARYRVDVTQSKKIKGVLRATKFNGTVELQGSLTPAAKKAGCKLPERGLVNALGTLTAPDAGGYLGP